MCSYQSHLYYCSFFFFFLEVTVLAKMFAVVSYHEQAIASETSFLTTVI